MADEKGDDCAEMHALAKGFAMRASAEAGDKYAVLFVLCEVRKDNPNIVVTSRLPPAEQRRLLLDAAELFDGAHTMSVLEKGEN
jgi:hypothetical protein